MTKNAISASISLYFSYDRCQGQTVLSIELTFYKLAVAIISYATWYRYEPVTFHLVGGKRIVRTVATKFNLLGSCRVSAICSVMRRSFRKFNISFREFNYFLFL